MVLGICDLILLLRFFEFCFFIVDEFIFLSFVVSGIWSLFVFGYFFVIMGRVEKKYLE